MPISPPAGFLEEQFPFHVAVDSELKIVSCGRSLHLLTGAELLNEPVAAHFEIRQPCESWDFEAISGSSGVRAMLDSRSGSRLRGQFVRMEHADIVVFLGSPCLATPEDLARSGLGPGDFAVHDPTPEFLPILEAQRQMLEETRQLANELAIQRAEATVAQEQLTLQYEITRILSWTLDRKEARKQVIEALTRLMKWDAGSSWLREPDGLYMSCVAHHVLDEGRHAQYGILSDITSCKRGEELPGYTWWAGEAIWIEDLHAEQGRYGENAPRYEGFVSGVVLPVENRGEVIGAVELLSTTRRAPDPAFLRLLEEVGIRIGQYVDRRMSDAALAKSENDYRLVVESVKDVIFRTSPQGNWSFLNPSWVEVTGYDLEQSVGQLFLDHVHPEDREFIAIEFQKVVSGGQQSLLRELRFMRNDGTFRWLEMGARAIRNERGAVAGTAGTLVDVTERREFEGKLIAARDEAHRANRAKSEFLSRMSHELRTPLNAVLGFGQLLEMADLKPPMADHVGFILSAGTHLLNLIDEVLDIARIESGRLALTIDEFPLEPLLVEARSLIGSAAAERSIVCVDASEGESQLVVTADRQRTKQVLLNLLSNAVKYNREYGQIRILSSLIPETDSVRIEISDTGEGIDPTLLERVFAPFDRAGAEQTEIQGTGLGLALSRSLVEAMGGTMGVRSTVGVGSTFWFELPTGTVREEATEPLSGGIEASVLCIEDNLSSLALVRTILTPAGVKVIPALRGRAGIELARTLHPGLIVLDLDLPDVHGLDVLADLRADERTREIPVIVTTSDSGSSAMNLARNLGASDFLLKPLDISDFVTAVRDQLDGHPAIKAAS
ncbi:MAG: ATP-binding protein [Dehalococcoidia bacterium]